MAAVTTIDTRPTTVNLNLYAGDDVELNIEVTDNAGAPVDLTGYTAKAQLRATADAPTALDFVATATGSTVTLKLPTAISATMPVKGVWDCEIASATGVITTLCGGTFTTAPDVSR